jgi:transcription elongation factor Elf1
MNNLLPDFVNTTTSQRIRCTRCESNLSLRLTPGKKPHWGRVDCTTCEKYVKFTSPSEAAANGLEMVGGAM